MHKRPDQPATRQEQALAEGRHVYSLMKTNWKAIAAYDQRRKKKLFPKASLDQLNQLIRAASTAMGGHALARTARSGAVVDEAKQRAVLVDLVQLIRDEIALAFPDDQELQRAVGVGKRLSTKINQDAIAIATDQQQAWESETYGPRMREAGIDKKRIDELIANRRALAGAGTDKAEALGDQVSGSVEKEAALRALRRATTHAAKVFRLVFRKDPAKQVQLDAGLARRPLRRKKKAPTPPPTTKPPTNTP